MAIFKPGRLRRVLNPIIGTGWLFTMYTPSYQVYEDEITSITITRGTNGRNVGHNPTVVEVGINGRYDTLTTGEQQRVFLREQQAAALAAYVGGTTGTEIVDRYQGRLGTISLDDTGKRFHTTVAGSSWLTQMNYSPAHFTPSVYQPLNELYLDMTKASEPLRGIQFGTALGSPNVTKYAGGEPTLYRDGIDTYAADIGVMFQEKRNGQTIAYAHTRRKDLALERLATEYPLMRNQAIAPGRYEQSNERPGKRIYYTIRNAGGGIATRMVEVLNPTGELREIENIDWTAFQLSDDENQLYREAYSRVHESSARLYTMPTVTVDLLMLLRQGSPYAKKIAGQMLKLEVGEPVFLSGDWPTRLRGVHFADGIKETVTPDSWTFDLSLVPHPVATGHNSPEVPGRAWDSMLTQWDQETREWNQI